MVQVEVNTPEEHMGDVIGDLNSRRGMIGEFIDKPANMKLVKASVPLSEMFQYVSTLRGMTKGAPPTPAPPPLRLLLLLLLHAAVSARLQQICGYRRRGMESTAHCFAPGQRRGHPTLPVSC